MKDLTKGKVTATIVRFAIPIFIGNLFQLFYSLVDTRIVGSTLGNEALAAVGATTTLNTLIVGFLMGLTNGFSVITARFFGAGDRERVRKSLAQAVMLGLTVSAALTAVSLFMLKSILVWLHMPAEHFDRGYEYISVILAGMTASMLYNICASVLRAIGDTVTPLCFLIFSTIVNIGLDYLFILGFNTNVSGAAYATVISQVLAFVLCVIYMYIRYPFLRLKKEDFKADMPLIKNLCATGMSMGFMQSLVSLGTVTLQSAINSFGTNIIVAHTAARKITEIFMLPFSVLGMTMTTYCGQNLGAGRIDRIKAGIRQALFIAWGFCLLVVAASYTIAPLLIRAVTATELCEVIDTAALYLRVDTLLYFVTAVITIFRNSLQGIGDNITPVISSGIELVGKVLVVLFLTPVLNYWGVIIAEPVVWVLMVIPLIVRMFTIPVLKTGVEVVGKKA